MSPRSLLPQPLYSALMASLLASVPARAQTAASDPSPAAAGPVQKLEAFETTGSRIRLGVEEADFSPMLTIGRTEIEVSGLTEIGEITRLIPQAFSTGSYEGIGFGGQQQGTGTTSDGSTASVLTQRTNINMRGLGSNNTLVLINGRRVARSGNIRGSDGYDLTGIPVSAIERVEVMTDGASAIYGSDALGGVVNIITRRDYSGTELTFAYENTFSSDTAVRTASLTHGIVRGPLTLSLSASFKKRNAFKATDRTFSSTDNWASLGGTSTGSSYSAGGFANGAGVIGVSSGILPGVGSQYARIPDGATGAALAPSAFAPTTVSADVGDRAKWVNLISPQFARTLGFRSTYDLKSGHQLYLNSGYSETRTHIEGMPVNFRNGLSVPAGYPGNPFGVPVTLYKTFWELGPIQGQKFTTNSNLNFAAGANGRLPGDWRYDLGVSWNRSLLRNDNALDPVLFTDASAPLIAARALVFFYDSRASQPNDPAVLRSMLRPGNATDRTNTITWSGSADGALPWFRLPAGAIRLAAGAERTTERITTFQSIPDSPSINLSLLGSFRRGLDSAYTETRAPVIAPANGLPGFYRADLTAAIRYDRYSDAGGDYSPRYGAQVRPLKWLLFRATRNYSFRAPSIQALYRPVTDSTNSNTSGFIDRQRNELVTGTIATKGGGNIGLKPEHAVSDNVGVVFEVPFHWFKGLSVSFDRMRLNYNDKIATSLSTLQEWADIAPARLIRDAASGKVIGIDTRAINIARQVLETFDYQINYQRLTRLGSLSLRLAATEYRTVEAIRIPGAPPVTSLHLYPTRLSWQTFWSKGPYGAGVSGFYQENSWTNATRATTQFASVIEWNVQASYDFGYKLDRAGALPSRVGLSTWQALRQHPLADTKLSVAINNIFDREPPHRQGQAGFGVTDPRMMRYSLTLRKKL